MEQKRDQDTKSTVSSLPPSYMSALDLLPPAPQSMNPAPQEQAQTHPHDPMEHLLSLGFAEDWARIALRRTNGNVDEAIAFCIDSGALDTNTGTQEVPSVVDSGKRKKKKSMWPFGSKKQSEQPPQQQPPQQYVAPPPQEISQRVQERSDKQEQDCGVQRFPSCELPSYHDFALSSGLVTAQGQSQEESALPTYEEVSRDNPTVEAINDTGTTQRSVTPPMSYDEVLKQQEKPVLSLHENEQHSDENVTNTNGEDHAKIDNHKEAVAKNAGADEDGKGEAGALSHLKEQERKIPRPPSLSKRKDFLILSRSNSVSSMASVRTSTSGKEGCKSERSRKRETSTSVSNSPSPPPSYDVVATGTPERKQQQLQQQDETQEASKGQVDSDEVAARLLEWEACQFGKTRSLSPRTKNIDVSQQVVDEDEQSTGVVLDAVGSSPRMTEQEFVSLFSPPSSKKKELQEKIPVSITATTSNREGGSESANKIEISDDALDNWSRNKSASIKKSNDENRHHPNHAGGEEVNVAVKEEEKPEVTVEVNIDVKEEEKPEMDIEVSIDVKEEEKPEVEIEVEDEDSSASSSPGPSLQRSIALESSTIGVDTTRTVRSFVGTDTSSDSDTEDEDGGEVNLYDDECSLGSQTKMTEEEFLELLSQPSKKTSAVQRRPAREGNGLQVWSRNKPSSERRTAHPRSQPPASPSFLSPEILHSFSSSSMELPTRSSLRNLAPVTDEARAQALSSSIDTAPTRSVDISERTDPAVFRSDMSTTTSVVPPTVSNDVSSTPTTRSIASTVAIATTESTSHEEQPRLSPQNDSSSAVNRGPGTNTMISSAPLPTASSMSPRSSTPSTSVQPSSSESVTPSVNTSGPSSRPPPLTQSNRVSSRLLPSAVAIAHDDEDDMGTVHGEAYVQLVSGGNAVSQFDQGDLYLRDDHGGVFVAVAAPLNLEDDNSPPTQTDGATVSSRVEDSGSGGEVARGGLLSNVRTALYGSAERQSTENMGIKRRVFLGFDIHEQGGQFYPTIHLLQPKLGPSNGPQAGRPIRLKLNPSPERSMAVRHAEVNTPPMWAGRDDPRECALCRHSAGMLFKVHHCRNCGNYVCNKCSKKDWPASMLPRTFVPEKEKIVRVCDSCAYVQEGFVDSLRAGDVSKALSFFSTGNVNLHNPMSIYKSEEFPIHAAVEGGSIHLVRWLLEDRKCSLYAGANRSPIKTAEGLSCLAIAAYFGHGDIMKYLVHNNGAKVSEITEVAVLARGLHAMLEAPGPLPELPGGKRAGFFGSKYFVPRELEEDPSSTTADQPRVGRPVTATIATGNRNIDQFVSTTAQVAVNREDDVPRLRPKRAVGKRRTFDPEAAQGIRLHVEQSALEVSRGHIPSPVLNNASPLMEEILREARASDSASREGRGHWAGTGGSAQLRPGLSHASQGLAASTSSSYVVPYQDEDVRSLTPAEMARIRQFNTANALSSDVGSVSTNITGGTAPQGQVSQQEVDNMRREAEQFSSQRQESDEMEVNRVLRLSARHHAQGGARNSSGGSGTGSTGGR